MQRKIMIDWNNQPSVRQEDKIDLEKILKTLQKKVKEGKTEFQNLNYKNIEKLQETCSECKKYIKKIKDTAFIPFKVSSMDDEMISNDVDLESDQKTSHTLVQKSQEFINYYVGRDLDRQISRRNILALSLQWDRRMLSYSKQIKLKNVLLMFIVIHQECQYFTMDNMVIILGVHIKQDIKDLFWQW